MIDWLNENPRRIWLFLGAMLLAVAVNKPLLGSAVYFLGLAVIPKEG